MPVDTGSRRTWAGGHYERVGNLWLLVSELLCEAVDIRAGQRVLDVAAGSGNTALAARRRFAVVTALDQVPALLDHARARAAADGLDIAVETGDARALPHADAAFDVALSTFGVMYVPDHRRAAAELVRVVRPGGRIGLASWAPDGHMGRLLDLVAAYSGAPPPMSTRWGTEDHIKDLFAELAASLTQTRRHWTFRFPSPDAFIDHFRAHFGPLTLLFGDLDPPAAAELHADLIALIAETNVSGDPTVVIPSPYLEAVVTRS